MKIRTMLLISSLVYFPSVVGTAHAGSIPLRERFLPPSIRLTIACTQAQRSECVDKGYWTCTGIWPPLAGDNMAKCQALFISKCDQNCGG